MNFKTIPKNGASWRERLLYELEFEEGEQLVDVEIYDQITQTVIAKLRLYGDSISELDIAPYIRTAMAKRDKIAVTNITIYPCSDACRITLITNGVSSVPRLYFREDISALSPKVLSGVAEQATIANGEVIRLTVYALESISMTLMQPVAAGGVKTLNYRTNGVPCEVVVPVSRVVDGERIAVSIRCDGGALVTHSFRVVSRDKSAYRLAWINESGGVECGSFAQSVKRSLEVKFEEVESQEGWYRRIVSSKLIRRLSICGVTQREMDRLLGLFLSPVIYRCVGTGAQQVRLLTDEVAFDEHGRLRKLEFDIEEEWKGGDK